MVSTYQFSLFLLIEKSPKVKKVRGNVAINLNIVYEKRFIMRLAGEKLEVMYETRNTQKTKTKNIYR